MKSKTKNGFVLIELLLSLTVMTIFFGVGVKIYQSLKETARSTQASEEASQIREIFENYLDTYGCCPKGIFPIEQWFDLSRKKLDFKAVFSGYNKSANPKVINFIQQVGLKEDALKKPLWIFLCNPWSQQTTTIAWSRLGQLRNRTTEWEQIEGIDFVFSYRPKPDEDLSKRLNANARKTENLLFKWLRELFKNLFKVLSTSSSTFKSAEIMSERHRPSRYLTCLNLPTMPCFSKLKTCTQSPTKCMEDLSSEVVFEKAQGCFDKNKHLNNSVILFESISDKKSKKCSF